MNIKRVMLSSFAAFAVMFILGGLWNALIMVDFYARHAPSNVRRPEDFSLLFIAVGYLLMTLFMTFLFAQSFKLKPSLGEGFQFGALFGVIATLPIYLILYGIWDISMTRIVVDSAWHLVEQGAGGMTLALTMFPAKSNAALSAAR